MVDITETLFIIHLYYNWNKFISIFLHLVPCHHIFTYMLGRRGSWKWELSHYTQLHSYTLELYFHSSNNSAVTEVNTLGTAIVKINTALKNDFLFVFSVTFVV